MNLNRAFPNLLDESDALHRLGRDGTWQGVNMLARAIGHEAHADGGAVPPTRNGRLQAIAVDYGRIIADAQPSASKRIIVTEDAADLAFGA